MKRLLIGAGILILFLGGLLIALPFLVSSDAVRNRILSHVEDLTGRAVSFSGNPSVSFSPFLGIKLQDLTLSDPSSDNIAPLIHIDQVQAQLNILPALMGEVRISKYHLLGPKVNLKVDATGAVNWRFNKGKLFEIVNTAQSDNDEHIDANIGTFIIEDGIINYEDVSKERSEQVTSISGQVSWENTDDPLVVDSNAIWHGEEVTTHLEIENLPTLLSGGETNTTANFSSPHLKLNFSGLANMISDLSFNGDLDFKSPSIDRLLTFLNMEIGKFGGLRKIEASGKLEVKNNSAQLTDALINFAEREGTGILSFTHNELNETKINGTLAFDELDMSDLIIGAKSKVEDGVSTPTLKNIQLDLRISANSVLTGDATMENVAAALTMEKNDWTLDIGHSESLGGNIILKFGERSENNKRTAFFDISAQDIDASEVSSLLGKHKLKLTGKMMLDATLKTNFLKDGFFTSNLNGSAKISMKEGELENLDLPSLMESKSNDQSEEPKHVELGGSTDFQEMQLELLINSGVASISSSKIMSEESQIRFYGYMNLLTNGIAFSAQQYIDTELQPVRVFIGGTFNEPLVTMKHFPHGSAH